MTDPTNALGDRLGRRRSAVEGGASEPDPDEEFAWFFREEFAAVVRTVFLVVRDRGRAEDVAQEAFVQLLRHWKKVSRYEMPDAWVRRVAIRLAVRNARREWRRRDLEAGAREPATAPGRDLDALRAVSRLPAKQRAAVVLFYFEDRPVVEVADLLDCSVNTAKVHLHRARARLKELLGEEDDDER